MTNRKETLLVPSGALMAVFQANASGNDRAKSIAFDDAITAIGSISSLFNALADCVYLRAQHPEDSLYVTDAEIADAIYSLSDCLNTQREFLIESENAKYRLQTARKQSLNVNENSKEA